MAENGNIVTRVRALVALHTFKTTEAGELAFEKGDIIKVVDRGYKYWWRSRLKGRNYVVRFMSLIEPFLLTWKYRSSSNTFKQDVALLGRVSTFTS